MTSFEKGEGSRVLTGLMVEKEMTAAADSGVHELHHFNIILQLIKTDTCSCG